MAKAKVEIEGLKVDIEGSPSEISELLEQIRVIEERRKERGERYKKFLEHRNKIAHNVNEDYNLTSIIKNYIKADYFNEGRTAREVLNKLRHEGVRVPSSTLHPVLARFVMKSLLVREKNNSDVWSYREVYDGK